MTLRSKIKVLVACEKFGRVRDAFRARGFDAWSCDTAQPVDLNLFHYQVDARDMVKNYEWDLVIAHPPCTTTCVSGNRWYSGTEDRQRGIEFFMFFADGTAHVPHVAIEHPVSVISKVYRPPDQYIQPWQFGHDASKKTGLWLKNLPRLQPTNVIEKDRYSNQTPSGQNKLGPSKGRSDLRGMTYKGIAEAMADQWGRYIEAQKKSP